MSKRQNKKNRKQAEQSFRTRKPTLRPISLQGVITPTCEPPRARSTVTPPMREILLKLTRGQILRWSDARQQYELLRSTANGSAYAKVRRTVAEALLSLGLVARGFNRAILNIVNAGLSAIGITAPAKRVLTAGNSLSDSEALQRAAANIGKRAVTAQAGA